MGDGLYNYIMYKYSITLENFRNFTNLNINFPEEKVIVIYGKNGSGKTSLLESIFYIFYGVSFRDKDISALINYNSYYLKAVLKINDLEFISYLDRAGNRRVMMNGDNVTRNKLRQFFLPIYSIGKDNLIDSSPSERRRMIDKLASLSIKGFRSTLSAYNRIIKYKKEAIIRKDVVMLNAINEKFYELYSIISHGRSQVLKELSMIGRRLGFDNIEFEFRPSILDYTQVEEVLSQELKGGRMLSGAIFDSISVKLNGMSARRFFSHGEKQYLWFLFFFEFIKNLSLKDEIGILLLMDEAFSVLDESKVKILIENVINGKENVLYFFTTQRKLPLSVSYLNLSNEYGRIKANS